MIQDMIKQFFRSFFTLKVTIYFKGSSKPMVIKCKEFQATKLSGGGDRQVQVTKPNCEWALDVNEIAGITVKKVIF